MDLPGDDAVSCVTTIKPCKGFAITHGGDRDAAFYSLSGYFFGSEEILHREYAWGIYSMNAYWSFIHKGLYHAADRYSTLIAFSRDLFVSFSFSRRLLLVRVERDSIYDRECRH